MTPDRLVTAEQFRIGGMSSVRGYAEGEALGDYGFNSTIELRVPPFFLPKEIPWFKKSLLSKETLQFVVFGDAAKAYLNKPRAGEDSSTLMTSAGVGVLFDLFRHVSLRMMLGFPLYERSEEENNPRLHFVLTSSW